MRAIFWASAAFLGATWVGYPAMLALQPRRPVRRGLAPGRVGAVCVARDEAPAIAGRVAALKAQTRPPDAIVVVDDGSRDTTAALAGQAGARVVSQPARGKAAGLAAGVAALGEVDFVVFCDVRQALASDAIEHLLRPFADPRVGCVSGLMTTDTARGPGWYWRYETFVRLLESRSGSVVGGTGALYAIRRELFVAPPAGLVLDDVWIPMHVARAGRRVVLEQEAHVVDVEAEPQREAARKTRTLAGNHQLLRAAPWLRDRRANPLYWRMLWHKRARLALPIAALGLGLSAAALGRRPGYAAVALGLGALVATWAVRRHVPGASGFAGRAGALAETVVELHVAAVRGFWAARRGDIPWASEVGPEAAREAAPVAAAGGGEAG